MTIDRLKLPGTIILIATLILGCSGTYGKIQTQNKTAEKVTLADLTDHWDNYDIYYARRSSTNVDAIMFDPKNNNTKLTGNSWIKIENQETLNKTLEDIQRIYQWVGIYIIEGFDNQFFGYMYYSGRLHIPVKIIDGKTLYVMSLAIPYSTP
jgi:hypothetical protein